MVMKTQNEMYWEAVDITPELAARWLKFNTDNRKLPVGNAKYYAKVMSQGGFIMTHQGLGFTGTPSSPGRLIDGQTRLTAIMSTQKTVRQWVCWNCPTETFRVIDGGRPRTFTDHYGWEKSKIAFVNILFWIATEQRRITKPEADRVWRVYGGWFKMLMDASGTCRKNLSVSAVRVGCVLAMHKNPESAGAISQQYAHLVNEEFKRMEPSVYLLHKKLLRVIGGGREAIWHQVPLTYRAMQPENFNAKTLHPTDMEKITADVKIAVGF